MMFNKQNKDDLTSEHEYLRKYSYHKEKSFFNPCIKIILSIMLIFSVSQAQASHIMGGDIAYECVGPNTYAITFKLYRDCNGISPSSSASINISSPTCGSVSSISLPLIGSPTNITPICPSQPDACNSSSGTYGIQEWLYRDTLTGLPSCDDWVLSWRSCCRNDAISTLSNPGNDRLYISSELDNTLSTCNSSPIFNSLATPFVCMNQPVNYSHGAYDPDGDSLVFSLVDCKDNANITVGYSSPFTGANPIPTNNLVVDSLTGNISFTAFAQAVSVMCVKVEEYRNGVKIGETNRDIQFSIIDCNSGSFSNFAPTATGINGTNNFSMDVCVGDAVNFTMNASDIDTGQTVTITALNSIPGATFVSNGAASPTGTFNWQTTNADSGQYNLTIEVVDDACPIIGRNIYTYSIRVLPSNISIIPTITNPSAIGACDGSISTTLTNNSHPTTILWSNGDTSASISNLCAGTYTINVSDTANCPSIISYTLIDSLSMVLTNSTNSTCNGANNGTATFNIIGGNAPYTINGQAYNSSLVTFNGLSAGVHLYTVTDVNNRTDTASVVITEPLAITITADTIIDAGCTPGAIYYQINNAVGVFQANWSPNTGTDLGNTKGLKYIPDSTNYTREYTCLNFYDISSTGTPLGLSDDGSTTINLPFTFVFYGSNETDIRIGNNGGASFGGYPSFGNSMNSATRGIYPLMDDLDSENGDVYYETLGSAPNRQFVIQWHQRPHFSGSGATDFTTFQVILYETSNNIEFVYEDLTYNNGSGTSYDNGIGAIVGITAGNGTDYDQFSYLSVFPTLNCTQLAYTDLTPNTYTLTVTDANGCSSSQSFTVASVPSGISISSVTPTQPICPAITGTITITAMASFSLEYSIDNGSTWQSSNIFTNVAAGTYNIIVRDANNITCQEIYSTPVTINSIVCYDATVTSTNATCAGGSDGSVFVTVTGGTAPYSDGTSTYQTDTFTISGLSAGAFSYLITDANGDTATVWGTITEPNPIIISAVETGCNFINNNGISVTASGGTGALQYSIDDINYQFSNFLYPLTGGTYTVYVKDANGCVNSLSGIVVSSCTNVKILSYTNPSPYSKLTPNHITPLDLGIEVENNGNTDVTNLVVTFDIKDGSGTSVFSETVTQAVFEQDSIQNFVPTMSFTPDTAIGGIYTVTYSIDITETETDTTDNIVVCVPLEITDSTHVKDDGNYVNGLGFNGGITSGIMGHTYESFAIDSISSVTVLSQSSQSTNVIGDTLVVYIYETNNGVPINNPLDTSNFILRDTSSNTIEWVFDFDTPVAIDTGKYFIGVHQKGINHAAIYFSYNIFTPNTGFYIFDGITWSTIESAGFPVAMAIRPNFTGYDPFEISITDSTDVSCSGSSDGSVEITVSKGTAPFTINGTQYNSTTINITGLSAGLQTFVVTDANNNTDSVSVTIGTVPDVTAPTLVTQAVTVYLNASGTAMITASDVNNGTTDNCDSNPTLSVAPFMFTCSNVGANNVLFKAEDVNGNTDSVVVIVTVVDSVSPTVVTQNVTVQLDATGNASVTAAQIDNGSSDNCGVASTSLDMTSFTCANVGANTVTLTVTDVNGNANTETATVTVEDNIMPTPATQNITVQLDATGNATITAAQIDNGSSDNCGVANLALDVTTFDCSNVGVNTVNLTVTDASGNQAQASAQVTVEDNVAPVVMTQAVTVQLDANGQASITTSDVNNGSSDNCGIATMTLDNTSFDCSSVGTNTVTLTVMDVNGNSNTGTATVTVEDVVNPTAIAKNITIFLDANGEANITAAQVNNGSSDNCGIASTTLDITDFTCSDLGENTVALTVEDNYGNTSTATAAVTVRDDIAPVLVCKPYVWEYDAGGILELTPEDLIESASDNCNYTATMSQSIFNDNHIGENLVSVTITDEDGNSTTCETIVDIRFGCIPLNSIITPNGDGMNDVWNIDCIASVNNELTIFNRFGQPVFNATNYTGGWDGRNNDGNELPQAAYYYVIKANLGGNEKIFKGNVTILKK